MNREKAPLYRKYNKIARGFHEKDAGGDFRHERNTKAMQNFEGYHKSIRRTQQGYDYTPLFKFLLSRVGREWNKVYAEATSRLDKHDPIFWMVDLDYEDGAPGIVNIGDNTFYSKLTVVDGVLVKADIHAAMPPKSCTCCTHSFNGQPY